LNKYTASSLLRLQAAKAWKLFIGQISFDMAEGDLFPFFSQFGTILELVLLRNQGDGRHKGCGFLVYSSAEEAEAALAANGAVMPNDARQRQIMVKYANAKGN
jgi:RNA-binding protein Musashi